MFQLFDKWKGSIKQQSNVHSHTRQAPFCHLVCPLKTMARKITIENTFPRNGGDTCVVGLFVSFIGRKISTLEAKSRLMVDPSINTVLFDDNNIRCNIKFNRM